MEKKMENIFEKARKIKLLLTDCDGVLTDGCVYYSNRGEELKRFSMRDGMGVERLKKLAGIETGIITGEITEIVFRRAEKLGITEYYPGISDKYAKLKEILKHRDIKADQVAYIGDDTNDMEIMKHVGLSSCPSDAMSMVKKIAHLVLLTKGGYGAFREFAELIIYSKQNNDEHTKKSSNWESLYW